MTSVEGSRFQVAVTELVPPTHPVGVQPSEPWPRPGTTALVTAEKPALPALAKPQLMATELILPGAAGSAWLGSIAFAVSQGASLPLLAAIGAAGVASVVVMGRNLVRSAAQARTSASKADPAMAETHLNYATNTALDGDLRVKHAYKYVGAVAQIPGTDAERLFAAMPTNRNWGIRKSFLRTSVEYTSILKSIGLGGWKQGRWTSYDLEATIVGLSKLGPVTDHQRARIKDYATNIVRSFHDRSDKKEAYLADLHAAVTELVRRAPAATDDAPLRQ